MLRGSYRFDFRYLFQSFVEFSSSYDDVRSDMLPLVRLSAWLEFDLSEGLKSMNDHF